MREQYRLQEKIDAEFQTSAVRLSLSERFAREADPAGALPAGEREARAVVRRREHMLGLAARSVDVRRERAGRLGEAESRPETAVRSTVSRGGTGKAGVPGLNKAGSSPPTSQRWRERVGPLSDHRHGRWDRDTVELLGPAIIDIRSDDAGEMRFVTVEANLDHRELEREGQPAVVELSWEGHDQGSPVNGRGWLVLSDDAKLRGHIWFHKRDH